MKKLINLQETLEKQKGQVPKKLVNTEESKRKQIHDYLKLGYALTKLDCIMIFGYINLGDYVYVLRKKYGKDYIKTTRLRNYKTGAEYAAYSIS